VGILEVWLAVANRKSRAGGRWMDNGLKVPVWFGEV